MDVYLTMLYVWVEQVNWNYKQCLQLFIIVVSGYTDARSAIYAVLEAIVKVNGRTDFEPPPLPNPFS